MENDDVIQIYGSKVHNLQNVSLEIPRNKLIVFTGISGSGKSSLAFDTIYAEGQRRYMETFSAYARQFIGSLERPDVEKINGLSPVIAIEQKTVSKNPRSTVGTITEIYDFLRLLYARIGIAYSHVSGKEMVKYSEKQIVELIIEENAGEKVAVLSPVVKGRKGHYKELFEKFRKKGFIYARIDGEITELKYNLKVDRYKSHNIEIVIDRLKVEEKEKRLNEAVNLAMKYGEGICLISGYDNKKERYYSRHLMCPESGISYNEPAPHTFSFNSPHGACRKCNGLGYVNQIDIGKIIPDESKSIASGGIEAIGKYKSSLIFWQLEAIAEKYGFKLNDPIKSIPENALNIIVYGSGETFKLRNTPLGVNSNYFMSFEGIANIISNNQDEDKPVSKRKWADKFISKIRCPECSGERLSRESLQFKIDGKSISDLTTLEINDLYKFLDVLPMKLSKKHQLISNEIIKEIKQRLSFLLNVGLNYLSLNRSSVSLSGGESQRIRLATQIGSQLVNVLYILDEPSIGLHQSDNVRLIQSLKELRDISNTVIVVEHDREMIESADYIVDIGPGAGRLGGKIVGKGSLEKLIKADTCTSKYLKGVRKIEVPEKRRNGNKKSIFLKGASGNNLKNVDVEFPLGKLICITGVSGSGKSSLINETLHPILSKLFYNSLKEPLPYESISGIEHIDKVIEVNQSPIGRTPRSNPATYTGIFSDIRKIFEVLPESKVRGYKAGRFSFNVKGGRCESCKGAGVRTIEMNFLPDVYIHCDDCNGNRYNVETLEVRYKGKSISDVLDQTINQAYDFFEGIPSIQRKIKVIKDVGLGYIKLGQSSTTLSGGEAQRIKLSSELLKKDTGKTLYILDEPTTGLHFEDIRVFLKVVDRLVEKGNTVIIIEHNMDVIKVADHIIDLGPGGGKHGGELICAGSPEMVIKNKKSSTGSYLKQELLRK